MYGDTEMYTNVPIGANAIIVNDDGRIVMMGVRGKDPKKGVLSTIGGFVELGESLEDALRREVMEEIKCEVMEAKYFTSVPQLYDGRMTLDVYFIVRIKGLPKTSAEVVNFKFITEAEECFSAEMFQVLARYFRTLTKR